MKFLLPTLLALLLPVLAPAAPKEPPPPPPPPMAQTQTLSIFRGRTVEIPLRAIGRAPGQLKFLIRSQPTHGKLGNLRVTGRKTAVVTYAHDNAAGNATDSFTFAVQAPDSPVSAPGEIRLVVSEEPPAMSVVHALDFGRLWLGETREEEITLQNTGGGVLAGRISVPDPWKILGSPEYRLGRRQQVRMRLAFVPDNARGYAGELLFSHDSRSTVRLTGEAASPFEFEPSRQVDLMSDGDSLLRTGTLVVRNRTDRPRTLEISVPRKIITQDDITIPAGGEQRLKLQTKSDFFGPLDGDIELESEGFRRTVPLRVYAVKPSLRVEPAGLKFGEVRAARRVQASLQIKNEGGAEARLHADIPPDLLLIPDPGSVVLAPGQTRKFEVAFEPQAAMTYAREIQIAIVNGPAIAIPVTATVTEEKKGPPSPGGTAVPTPEPIQDTPPPLANYNGVPRVEDIKPLPVPNRSVVELSWARPRGPVASWVVEGRVFQDGKIAWDPWPGVKFREENGRVVGRFENMPSGRYIIRISSLDGSGGRSEPSPLVSIAIPPRPSWHLFRWFLGALVVAAAVYILRQRQARQRATDAEEEKRLARLDPDN